MAPVTVTGHSGPIDPHGATIMLQIRDHMQPLTHSLHPGLGLAEALDRLHRANLGACRYWMTISTSSDFSPSRIAFPPCSRAAITATPVLWSKI